jgi:hypothetical protein
MFSKDLFRLISWISISAYPHLRPHLSRAGRIDIYLKMYADLLKYFNKSQKKNPSSC